MKEMLHFIVLPVLATSIFVLARPAGLVAANCCGPFRVTASGNGWLITECGKNVLFYQRQPKDRDGRYRRANYIHPLYDLDGNVITEDFPSDHYHHRGIFWAWHQVLVDGKQAGDAWEARRFDWQVTDVNVIELNHCRIAIRARVVWKSPDIVDNHGKKKAIVAESTVIRVHRRTKSTRSIDFDISLRALMPKVWIGGSDDDKGYGGFSARIALNDNMTFTGTRGDVRPQVLAIDAGPWLDISTNGTGLAILTHPKNPPPYGQWILRRARSMQNAVYPGRTPVPVSDDRPLRLRYRLVLHREPLRQKRLDALQSAFSCQ